MIFRIKKKMHIFFFKLVKSRTIIKQIKILNVNFIVKIE